MLANISNLWEGKRRGRKLELEGGESPHGYIVFIFVVMVSLNIHSTLKPLFYFTYI